MVVVDGHRNRFSAILQSFPDVTPGRVILSLASVLDILDFLKQIRDRLTNRGVYEILDYDSTLELLDPKGKTALFKRRQRIKFLQDNVIAYQDLVWGDGEIFADYKCSPGVEVDRYQEGDRWNVLISLRETKSKGDVEDFYIERKVRNGFTKSHEARQCELRHATRRLRLSVIFPRKRRCKRAVLLERNRSRTTVLDHDHFLDLPDGRQVLTWETGTPRRFETYTIKWTW